jgi:hypothetical protein
VCGGGRVRRTQTCNLSATWQTINLEAEVVSGCYGNIVLKRIF